MKSGKVTYMEVQGNMESQRNRIKHEMDIPFFNASEPLKCLLGAKKRLENTLFVRL